MAKNDNQFNMRRELASAYRYSVALRQLLGTGLEPLTDDHPLCQWSGRLLPLESVDREREHGTDRGYQQHRRAGETPCEACVTAHTVYQRRFKKRKSAC